MNDEVSWQTLAREMSDVSEQAFCAGWMDQLEYRLWEIVHGGSREYGQITVSDDQIVRLRSLSRMLRGWVWFNNDFKVEEFVDLARWKVSYKEWAHRRPMR